jgi:tetratricopeptide (TPR) repeat protein
MRRATENFVKSLLAATFSRLPLLKSLTLGRCCFRFATQQTLKPLCGENSEPQTKKGDKFLIMEIKWQIRPSKFDITDMAYSKIVIGTIILLGCVLYAHTLPFPFVWDGRGYILGNPLIKGFGYYDDILNIGIFAQLDEKLGIPSDYVNNFILRPITYLTFSINYLLGGNNPVGYRACNIGIHIFNATIVYLLLEIILKKSSKGPLFDRFSTRLIPTATALLFLIHPLQTEAVIYITQRFTSLAASFYLLTAFLYLHSITRDEHRRVPVPYWASVVTLLAGMLTKEVVFTAPFVLLTMEIIVLGNSWKVFLKRLLPHLFCLPIIPSLVMITSAAQNSSSISLKSSINIINFYNYPIEHYAITQLCAISTYIRLFLLPFGQNADHDYPLYTSLLQDKVILSLVIITVIVVSSFLIYQRKPKDLHRSLLLFGVAFFFISISVTSSIVPMAELMVERRAYLPSFGAFLSIVCIIDLLRIKWSTVISRNGLMAGLTVWLIILSGVTYARSEVWRTSISFWQDSALKSRKPRPILNLVEAYFNQKQYERAAAWQQKLIALYPDDLTNYLILEEIQYVQGLYSDTIETGIYALSRGYRNERVYYFLGLAYSKVGLLKDAEQALKYAVALQPKFSDAHLALARFYSSAKNYSAALEQCRIAAKIDTQNKNLVKMIQDLEGMMENKRSKN